MKTDQSFTGNMVLQIHCDAMYSARSLRGPSAPRRRRSNCVVISVYGKKGSANNLHLMTSSRLGQGWWERASEHRTMKCAIELNNYSYLLRSSSRRGKGNY